MGFGDRSVIGEKWSSRMLWLATIGTAVGFYMVAVERQMQNRARKMAEALESSAEGGD